tara:strand:+ start:13451 stop:13648 length:198 start_codon:yes stop_codon:yes gene_type:complete
MKEMIGGYRTAGKLQKGNFKRLTDHVIDFYKRITITFNQCLACMDVGTEVQSGTVSCAAKAFKFH